MIPKALIYVHATAVEGVLSLQRKLFNIQKSVELIEASSVYKRSLPTTSIQEVEMVVEVSLKEESDYSELQQRLQETDSLLLAVEGELRITPNLPLPHPRLLLDTFILKMAAECAPYWEHRVKQQTLQALSSQNLPQDHVEFLTQGKALINVSI